MSAAFPRTESRLPVLFVGHGSPMNAIEDNEFSRAWLEIGKILPRPAGILCVSAHWQTRGTHVTAMPRPRTIYDFYGFPRALYEKTYPAPGSTGLAEMVRDALAPAPVGLDQGWGLDHGAWSVLCRLFPEADVPVVQLSLDVGRTAQQHYDLARGLRELRRHGVLIVGSGNMVHNLGVIQWADRGFDWAVEMDRIMAERILARDHAALIAYEGLGPAARLAIPTDEHYLPLLYTLAQQEEGEELRFFAERVTLGSISMRSVWIG